MDAMDPSISVGSPSQVHVVDRRKWGDWGLSEVRPAWGSRPLARIIMETHREKRVENPSDSF